MQHLTFKKMIVLLVVIGLAAAGYTRFKDLPVTRIAFVEHTLQKGPPGLFSIALSKVVDSRRELIGNDAYRVYAYVSDPDGLQYVSLTHNGKPIPFEVDTNKTQAELEFEGDSQSGLHKYVLVARDTKGKESTAALLVSVKLVAPLGGVAF